MTFDPRGRELREPREPERREVEVDGLPIDEGGDKTAGGRSPTQSHVSVTEGINDVREADRAVDQRQRVRQRRPMSHPAAAAFDLEPREHLARRLNELVEAGRRRRRIKPAEL